MPRETILLVEDEREVRLLVRRVLESEGFEVIDAAGPAAALILAAAPGRRVDLLLTDVVMPGMNGVDLADRLLADRPGLKVVFMSGYADDSVDLQRRRHAVFIQKPYRLDDLVIQIRDLLAQGERPAAET